MLEAVFDGLAAVLELLVYALTSRTCRWILLAVLVVLGILWLSC